MKHQKNAIDVRKIKVNNMIYLRDFWLSIDSQEISIININECNCNRKCDNCNIDCIATEYKDRKFY
jgi:hypothetical protein